MSDNYKQKYEDLMKRCEEFNIWFEDHKRKMKRNLGPAKTEDIQWPRDYQAWPPITTTPWPPGSLDRTYGYNICAGCGQDLNKLTHYVCYHPNCPSQMRVTSTTGPTT